MTRLQTISFVFLLSIMMVFMVAGTFLYGVVDLIIGVLSVLFPVLTPEAYRDRPEVPRS